MRKERASANMAYRKKSATSGELISETKIKEPRSAHYVYPIAVRLDTRFPQSGLKGHSEAIPPRKTRQTRRKSKTQKAN